MKIALAVIANFAERPVGGPSMLTEPLAGTATLIHTLRRTAQCTSVDTHLLVVDERAADTARGLMDAIDHERFTLYTHAPIVQKRLALVRAARKWNLHSWRGGHYGFTWYDEYIAPGLLRQVCQDAGVDAVLAVDGHQPLVDPAILDDMVRQQRRHTDAGFTFTAAPPGLSGLLLRRELLDELATDNMPLGFLLTYRPERPSTDPLIHPTCLHVDPRISATGERFVADTHTARSCLEQAIDALGQDVSAGALCQWARSTYAERPASLPFEIELELTTADPLPATRLSPRGKRTAERAITDLGVVERLLTDFANDDDRLLVLAGFGEPLLSPLFPDVCRLAREVGVFGIAVETTLLEAPPIAIDALFEYAVDTLFVRLDAHSAETYEALHGAPRLHEALAAIDAIAQRRNAEQRAAPLLVPGFTKCGANLPEMEAFYDDWIRRCGSAVIRGYNDYCGVLPTDTLLYTTPPTRVACRRLPNRLMLLADGAVAQCGQDVNGKHALGNWFTQSLDEVWNAAPRQSLLALHTTGEWATVPLCANCQEWHRP